MPTLRYVCCCALFVVGLPFIAAAEDRPITFEQHVRPILKAYCLDCHGGEKVEGALDLRLKRFAERGGDTGAAIVAGKPAESLLLERLLSGEMPPTEKKVPADQIAIIERWIAGGAATAREEPASLPPGIDITPEDRAYWAFQPLRRPRVPEFATEDRARTPVDAFILQRLKENELGFAPEADRLTLIKRAAFDLTGLPPSQSAIEAFLSDTSETAYEKMLERLLASPQYGERWARHWLDVAGYADSDGDGTNDTLRPYAYKYRDYVVRALNADKPLDQFIIEQLAGDELAPQPWNNLTSEKIELLAATGFLRTAADGTASSGDLAEASNLVVADTLKIVSSSLLGLTVGCAQCHDHRYDPIPQADYFRMRAIFEPALNPQQWRRPRERLVSLYTDADRAKAAAIEAEAQVMQQQLQEKTTRYIKEALEAELSKFPEADRDKLRAAAEAVASKRTPDQQQLLASNPRLNINAGVLYQYNQARADELKADNERVAAKRKEKPIEDFVSIASEVPGQLPATRLFHRGDYRQPKQAVAPGDLTILAFDGAARWEAPAKDETLPTSGRRLAYAKHLTSGDHPLVGRTLANRIWLHHFGRGIVSTPGDFGQLGTRPSHPELLDYLATELPARGWSLKQLHRLIMTSSVYRQSSRRQAAQDAVDRENALYGRFPLRRLEAEALRDRMLFVSGRLDRTLHGPAIAVAENTEGHVAAASTRRSLYLQVRRTKPESFLTAFDAPVVMLNCENRVLSTSTSQALMLMNSEQVLLEASEVAQRVLRETPHDYQRDLTVPLVARFPRAGDVWQYGYGKYDETAQRVAGFAPLTHFTGSAWQGGAKLPDEKTGWALLTAAGGHAGNDAQHAAIRRWTATEPGSLLITGELKHAATAGDGVRGRIVSSRVGLAGHLQVNQSQAASNVERMEVQRGDTVDFVVDCLGDVNCDSFEWNVELVLTTAEGEKLAPQKSAAAFRGPSPAPLPMLVAYAWQTVYQRPATVEELVLGATFLQQQIATLRAKDAAGDHETAALTNLCQQLLSSNEFLYVD